MNVLVFDIETIPDVESGRRILDLTDLDDEAVAKAMFTRQAQKTGGSDFLPLHLHRVVAISAVLREDFLRDGGDAPKVWSLGEEASGEAELIGRFYEGIARFSPTLVSWNGSGFDLPVMHYRALLNGVDAHRYWDTGDDDREMRYNNYLSRYHSRHTDLMDVLAGYNLRAAAPLDEVAVMLGFPGKLGMSGARVWDAWLAGEIGAIRNYCETDVLNTYLVYLRWETVRGNLDEDNYQRELEMLKQVLADSEAPHLAEFLKAWNAR